MRELALMIVAIADIIDHPQVTRDQIFSQKMRKHVELQPVADKMAVKAPWAGYYNKMQAVSRLSSSSTSQR
jgi:hypothetical protein